MKPCPDCPTPQACKEANYAHCVAGDQVTPQDNLWGTIVLEEFDGADPEEVKKWALPPWLKWVDETPEATAAAIKRAFVKPVTPKGNERTAYEMGKAAVLGLSYGMSPEEPKRWDLRDEDGDLHSPAWYIEAFITAREAYLEAHGKDTRSMTAQEQDAHMNALDDLLLEYEMYENYVNQLFGYPVE